MKGIGFNNFRKFKELPFLEFGNITILVGGNNAGKSTVVKAIVTVLTFLKEARFDLLTNKNSIINPQFFFNKNPYAHIGTFKRALCNDAEDDIITFEIHIEEISFSIELRGDRNDENAVSAMIERLHINDRRSRISLRFDFCDNMAYILLNNNIDLFIENEDFERRYAKIENDEVENENISIGIANRQRRNFFTQYPVVTENKEYKAEITKICEQHMVGGPLVPGLIYNLSGYFVDEYENGNDQTKEQYKTLYRISPYFQRLRHRIEQLLLFTPVVEYLYAHSASQKVLYYSMDKNDFLVQTIHNFANQRFPKTGDAYKFVRYWMREFNVGEEFEIKSIGGEAHTVDITDNGKVMPLADKGMGSIQIMILLFRLAMDVNEKSLNRISRNSTVTILVEEPEQNLHPRMQSLLMDFFYKVSEDYGIKFVIETHSEYLVRRSQILVAEKKYKDIDALQKECPIKVYYFPSDGTPEEMKYGINGRFEDAFGPGFFDESSNSSLLLSRIERGRI